MDLDGDKYEFVGPNGATLEFDRVTTVISGVFGKHTAPAPRVEEGVQAHAFLEALATDDGTVFGPDELTGYQQGVLNWLRDYRPKVLSSELTLVNRELGYAGTVDLIVWNQSGLGYTIIDLKTRRETWTKAFLTDKIQVQAYRAAYPDGYACDTAVLLARADGTYVYDDSEVDADVWFNTLALYRSMQASGVTLT